MPGVKGMKKSYVTKAEKLAGARNLQKWKADNPEGGNLTHGAYSSTVKKRYTDLRTTEGRHLQTVIDNIKADLGNDLDQRQCILLDRIKEKLIVLLQIGDHIDKQKSVIKGDALIACLGSNYIAYDNSLTRSLTLLYESAHKKPTRVPTIEQLAKANDEHN